MRIALGFIVLALACWLAWSTTHAGELTTPAEAQVWTSSSQCATCHQEIYDEWKDSWHARSWIDEDVRVQSNDFANKDCIDCHAPQPVFITEIGKRVLPRSSRREEGVDCISCHLLPNGRMAGTITNDSAACRPEATIALQRVTFCACCHDQHRTVRQWTASSWPERNQDCVTCHMPYKDGDPTQHRLHGMAGGHDIALVRSAVLLTGEHRDDHVHVRIENVGAGHAFPTDERSRAADLFWRPAGETAWTHFHRIRDPYRYETHIESTLLHADEARDLKIPHGDGGPAPGQAIEVALFYKLTPYYRDPDTGQPRVTEEVTDPQTDAELVHLVTIE